MNILFITHYIELLGANRSLMQLIIELRSKGVQPVVLIPKQRSKDSTSIIDFLIRNRIQYIEAPIRMIKHHLAWKSALSYFYAIWLRRKVLYTLRGMNFDIIHTNSSVIDIGAYISRRLNKPHIWHLREFGDLDYNFKTPFCKQYQKIIYRGGNHFIAISRKIMDHYKPYVGGQPIHLIYNGIKPLRSIMREAREVVQFCIVGLIHENKRQLDVVKAVDILVNQEKITNIHLTIVGGGDRNYLECMHKYISEKHIESYIEFTGQRNDVHDILKNMDVGIMASSNEAFGRVTVEYMMNGLAVVASNGGANTEIIENEKSGLIYPTGNCEELAKKMQYLINNRSKLVEISKSGYEVAISKFSSSVNSDSIYKLYSVVMQ